MEQYQTARSNQNYINNSALQMRLNTKPIIQDVELFLRDAELVTYQDEKSGAYLERVEVPDGAEPLLNERGVRSVLNWLTTFFNTQTVQGNFPEERYDIYIYELHSKLATVMMNNWYEWDVSEENYSFIISSIMNTAQPFISRLIHNKERESYQDTIKSIESSTHERDERRRFGI